MRKHLNLSLINENLLYKVLTIPSFSEKEYRMQDFLLEYSRQKLHTVLFLTGSSETALSRTTTVKLCLNEIEVKSDAGRTAVNDTADSWTVAFTEGGKAEKSAEGIHEKWMMSDYYSQQP